VFVAASEWASDEAVDSRESGVVVGVYAVQMTSAVVLDVAVALVVAPVSPGSHFQSSVDAAPGVSGTRPQREADTSYITPRVEPPY
jgi:hypothetical protein